MILEMDEARDTLRLDGDDGANDMIVHSLIEAIPAYLETATGKSWEDDEHPLAKTVAQFLLQLWFDPQDRDTERLKRTIDTLLVALTAIGRKEK